ncbi:MAG: hypothetical protein CMH52_10050 [Myxococcales bacterium]|nr:hypothetical protein [Myxococcales bacterium]
MDNRFFPTERTYLWVVILLINVLCAGCSPPNERTQLDTPPPLSAHKSTVRIATPRAAFGLIKYLAQNYMDEGKGRSVIVEEPLAGNGPQLAYEAGLVDVAIGIHWRLKKTAREFARTELVLALGPGISDRQLSLERLTQFVDGSQGTAVPGRDIKYLSRSVHDPLTQLFADAYPSLAASVLAAAAGVRVPADEDSMAFPRKTAVKRNAFCLALEGNLRMYGIPTWIGRLPMGSSEVSLTADVSETHRAAQAFLTYLVSSQGQGALLELGFRGVVE